MTESAWWPPLSRWGRLKNSGRRYTVIRLYDCTLHEMGLGSLCRRVTVFLPPYSGLTRHFLLLNSSYSRPILLPRILSISAVGSSPQRYIRVFASRIAFARLANGRTWSPNRHTLATGSVDYTGSPGWAALCARVATQSATRPGPRAQTASRPAASAATRQQKHLLEMMQTTRVPYLLIQLLTTLKLRRPPLIGSDTPSPGLQPTPPLSQSTPIAFSIYACGTT